MANGTELRICHPGSGGASVLPLWGEDEQRWPDSLRAVLYGAGMIYLFMGVAIIADSFVCSIDVVTSRRRQYKLESGQIVTEKVWNDTVATLSLMALGSSAPEIALSVVDLFKKRFTFTPLGAQTIAGSAAFNLLIIVAVCIVIIPSNETRKIAELPAFYVTAIVSIFAYLWLALILVVSSPDTITIWEAIVTLVYMPMLIWIAYKVDIGDGARLLAFFRPHSAPLADKEAEEVGLGKFAFESEAITVDAGTEAKEIKITIPRPAGARGAVSCGYCTEPLNAVPGFDYTELEGGRLDFNEECTQQSINLEILPKAANRPPRRFLLILQEAEGNAGFDESKDGGKDAAYMTVTINSPAKLPSSTKCFYLIDSLLNFNGMRRGNQDWIDQITASVYCLGSKEEQMQATALDWVGHAVSLPWKLCLSLVPPPSYFGGWACFYGSLAGIALLTVFISDLAELFGCVIGIADDVTAIVFVSLGTSMPDLFASLTAAKEDETADASIVNVTGSNSVNVFLGLGLPWTIGSIYWAIADQTDFWRSMYPALAAERGADGGAIFVVESKNLGFCVVAFGVCCIAACIVLTMRRQFLGAELGGPFIPKVMSGIAFVVFWLVFISVSSWRAMRWQWASMEESIYVIGGASLCGFVMMLLAVVTILAYRGNAVPDGSAPDNHNAVEARGVGLKPISARLNNSGSALSIGSNKTDFSLNTQVPSEGEGGVCVLGMSNYIMKPSFNRHPETDPGSSRFWV